MKRVLIVGGGFAGLHLVRHLEKRLRADEAEVTCGTSIRGSTHLIERVLSHFSRHIVADIL